MINLVPRKEIPLRLTVATTAIAILLTLIAGAGIFGVLGYKCADIFLIDTGSVISTNGVNMSLLHIGDVGVKSS